jgi:hypothetical protein
VGLNSAHPLIVFQRWAPGDVSDLAMKIFVQGQGEQGITRRQSVMQSTSDPVD